MRNLITAAATSRTRALSILAPSLDMAAGNGTRWTNGLPLARTQSPFTLNHRFMDVIPAPEAGRGVYASTKQDRPPRGELR